MTVVMVMIAAEALAQVHDSYTGCRSCLLHHIRCLSRHCGRDDESNRERDAHDGDFGGEA